MVGFVGQSIKLSLLIFDLFKKPPPELELLFHWRYGSVGRFQRTCAIVRLGFPDKLILASTTLRSPVELWRDLQKTLA